jgi:glutamine amidotransferase
MSVVLAALTSDPNLLPCELHRLEKFVNFAAVAARSASGLAWFSQDDVLQRRFPAEAPPRSPRDLMDGETSDAVLFHSRPISATASLEENTQPFKFRRWLFAHDGEVQAWSRVRMSAIAALPEHLQRGIRGDSDSEVLFALFLKELRDTGRTDDVRLEPELAAKLLLKAGAVMERLTRDAGATEPSGLSMVATNGRMLLAARAGPTPLFYKLLEGTKVCERCGIDETTKDSDSRVPSHRRVRTVVVTTAPGPENGWLPLEQGEALAVDLKLNGKKVRA